MSDVAPEVSSLALQFTASSAKNEYSTRKGTIGRRVLLLRLRGSPIASWKPEPERKMFTNDEQVLGGPSNAGELS
jgi:hypothetical protein